MAFATIVTQPDTKEKLTAVGAETTTSTPDELGAFFRKEIARWGNVVSDAAIGLNGRASRPAGHRFQRKAMRTVRYVGRSPWL